MLRDGPPASFPAAKSPSSVRPLQTRACLEVGPKWSKVGWVTLSSRGRTPSGEKLKGLIRRFCAASACAAMKTERRRRLEDKRLLWIHMEGFLHPRNLQRGGVGSL